MLLPWVKNAVIYEIVGVFFALSTFCSFDKTVRDRGCDFIREYEIILTVNSYRKPIVAD